MALAITPQPKPVPLREANAQTIVSGGRYKSFCTICTKDFSPTDTLVIAAQVAWHKRCFTAKKLCPSDADTLQRFEIQHASRKILVPLLANPLVTTYKDSFIQILTNFGKHCTNEPAAAELIEILLGIFSGEKDHDAELQCAAELVKTILLAVQPHSEIDLEALLKGGDDPLDIPKWLEFLKPFEAEAVRITVFLDQIFRHIHQNAEVKKFQKDSDELFLKEKIPADKTLLLPGRKTELEAFYTSLNPQDLQRLKRLVSAHAKEISAKETKDVCKTLVPVMVLSVLVLAVLAQAQFRFI